MMFLKQILALSLAALVLAAPPIQPRQGDLGSTSCSSPRPFAKALINSTETVDELVASLASVLDALDGELGERMTPP